MKEGVTLGHGTSIVPAGYSAGLPSLPAGFPAGVLAGTACLGTGALVQSGEDALAQPIAPLPLTAWLDFTRTGRRTGWEDAYFSRRARLCALVLAECVQHSGRCLEPVLDTLWAICEESAWQLPAHNSYIRDTPQLPLPDTTRPVVDLFAAETGGSLALVHYLLGAELESAAPGICQRLYREVEDRVLQPWRSQHFWWMGDGAEPMCNWTSWCTQNLLLATFCCPPPRRSAGAPCSRRRTAWTAF